MLGAAEDAGGPGPAVVAGGCCRLARPGGGGCCWCICITLTTWLEMQIFKEIYEISMGQAEHEDCVSNNTRFAFQVLLA